MDWKEVQDPQLRQGQSIPENLQLLAADGSTLSFLGEPLLQGRHRTWACPLRNIYSIQYNSIHSFNSYPTPICVKAIPWEVTANLIQTKIKAL